MNRSHYLYRTSEGPGKSDCGYSIFYGESDGRPPLITIESFDNDDDPGRPPGRFETEHLTVEEFLGRFGADHPAVQAYQWIISGAEPMLLIENLHATVAGKPILKGLTLALNAGEVHAIMGPNGAGKSTLAYVLGGRPGYEVTEGSVTLTLPRHAGLDPASTFSSGAEEGKWTPDQVRGDEESVDLLALEPHERAAAGLFLGFQYPVEIPGVSNVQFLRTALNAQRRARGEAEISAGDFLRLAREQGEALGMPMDMLKRGVNVGFSGGEKKRNEMVQMGIVDPRLAVLDETDSGLDIDALRVVADGINRIMRRPDKAVLLITHYQRLLDLVVPDFVHVLAEGRIVRSGGPELARLLEREGYGEMAA